MPPPALLAAAAFVLLAAFARGMIRAATRGDVSRDVHPLALPAAHVLVAVALALMIYTAATA